jgi:hypothetical protein
VNAAKKKAAAEAPAAKPLEQLTGEWARAKNAEETAKKEADRLRAEILRDPRAKPGYEDANLVIGETSKLDLEDKRLEEVLRETGNFEKAQETKVTIAKVRAIAELEPAVAKVVEKVTTTSPRFERAAKKS